MAISLNPLRSTTKSARAAPGSRSPTIPRQFSALARKLMVCRVYSEQPKSLRHPRLTGVRDRPRKPGRQGFDDGVDRLESASGEIVEDRLNERIRDARIPRSLHKMVRHNLGNA